MTGQRFLSRRLLLLAVVMLLYWVLLATVLRDNLGSSARLFNDYADRADYFLRGAWLPEHAVPYRDVPSEYPQVPTYLFGALYLPFIGQSDANSIFLRYSILFALVMIVLYIALAALLDRMLAPERKGLVFALLLPAPLYFAYNRFDVLPSLVTLAALFLVRRGRWIGAGALLGFGTLTKWYPALIVFPVLAHMRSRRIPASQIIGLLGAFSIACGLILLPTYIEGGWRAVLAPYVLHASRGLEQAALPTLIQPLIWGLVGSAANPLLEGVFLLLQLAVASAALFAHIDTFDDLLDWCVLILAAFVVFSRVYSPQWVLWIFPLLLLLAGSRKDFLVIITLGVLTYVEYPVLYVGFGLVPNVMTLVGWMNAVLWAVLGLWGASQLIWRKRTKVTQGGRDVGTENGDGRSI